MTKQNEYYADIAASIQKVTEEMLLKMAGHLHEETGLRRLCMAGGVALNSVANGRLLRETAFEEIYVQPAAGDSGGACSILADPRRPEMKDTVNVKIKFREPFRPFAPSVIESAGNKFFEITEPEKHYPNRFMLYVVPVRDQFKEALPAITHVDGSARIQTVRSDTAPLYHELIETFGEATGVPVVMNTSFNLRGEPIVTTPAHARSTPLVKVAWTFWCLEIV